MPPTEPQDHPLLDGGRGRADAVQLQALLNQIPAYIWTVDRDLVLTSHTGSERDPRRPHPGQTLMEAWRVEPDADAIRHHGRALEGKPSSYEHVFEGRRYQVHIEPLRDDVGEVRGAIGVSVDVTELRRAEQAEHRLAALVESADHAIYSGDVDGTIRTWNEGAERLFGWTEEEILGRDASILVPEGTEEPDTSGVAHGERYRFQTRRSTKGGQPVETDITVSPIVDGDGHVIGASVIAHDISQRVEARRELAQSEQRFRGLAERSRDPVYLFELEPQPGFAYVSPTIERITGLSSESIVDDTSRLVDVLHPDDRGHFDIATLRGRREPSTEVLRLRTPEGRRWRWLEDHRLPLVENGRTVAVQGVLRDISAQRETERALRAALEHESQAVQELEALDELKSSFLQAVSHELRTPLTSVLGIAQTLEEHQERLPGERVAELVSRLRRNAERLDRLLSDLLDLERLTKSEVAAEQRPEDLSELVRAQLADLETADHSITAHLEPTPVHAERRLVERIVENLVRNAQRHTPPGTHIHVRVAPQMDGGVLEVEDEGPGIEPELRDQLFEPFVQGPGARTSPTPGTGIGLSLVDRFSRLQGGRVWVGEAQGGGARFTVWLPATAAQAAADDHAPPGPRDRAGPG